MQLSLSNQLPVITEEINFFKQQAGQAVFEIGRRLKHVRDNNLVHGEWEAWCENNLNITSRQARKYIRVFERFSNRNLGSEIGLKKMDLLAEFTDEELETPVTLPSGVDKKPIEMTNKEIEAFKKEKDEAERRVKEAEARAKQAEQEKLHWEKKARSAENMPPRVVTQTVEVVPEKVKKEMEDLKFQVTNLRTGYQDAKSKLQAIEMQNTVDFDAEQARKQREKLQHEADFNTLEIRVHINNFLEKVAITSYMQGALAAADPVTKKKLSDSVEMLETFTNQIKAALRGRILGGVVNE